MRHFCCKQWAHSTQMNMDGIKDKHAPHIRTIYSIQRVVHISFVRSRIYLHSRHSVTHMLPYFFAAFSVLGSPAMRFVNINEELWRAVKEAVRNRKRRRNSRDTEKKRRAQWKKGGRAATKWNDSKLNEFWIQDKVVMQTTLETRNRARYLLHNLVLHHGEHRLRAMASRLTGENYIR